MSIDNVLECLKNCSDEISKVSSTNEVQLKDELNNLLHHIKNGINFLTEYQSNTFNDNIQNNSRSRNIHNSKALNFATHDTNNDIKPSTIIKNNPDITNSANLALRRLANKNIDKINDVTVRKNFRSLIQTSQLSLRRLDNKFDTKPEPQKRKSTGDLDDEKDVDVRELKDLVSPLNSSINRRSSAKSSKKSNKTPRNSSAPYKQASINNIDLPEVELLGDKADDDYTSWLDKQDSVNHDNNNNRNERLSILIPDKERLSRKISTPGSANSNKDQ